MSEIGVRVCIYIPPTRKAVEGRFRARLGNHKKGLAKMSKISDEKRKKRYEAYKRYAEKNKEHLQEYQKNYYRKRYMTAVCDCCGAPIVENKVNPMAMCWICKMAFRRLSKGATFDTMEKAEKQAEFLRIRKEVVEKSTTQKKHDNAERVPEIPSKYLGGFGVCPFCGKRVTQYGHKYCNECIREGFDVVHRFTGRSNGWDRVQKQNIIRSGWRGQKCIASIASKTHLIMLQGVKMYKNF